MAKDNEQYARQQELAQAFNEKRKARYEQINQKLRALQSQDMAHYAPMGFAGKGALINAFTQAFAKNKYPKPSVFVREEFAWMLTDCVYPRFHEAFYDALDRMQEYPTDVSWHRRGFRSRQWAAYSPRFYNIFNHFWQYGFLDADICDTLTGNLPEDALCYLQDQNHLFGAFVPQVLAFELDKGNPKLEQIVTDIINGENSFTPVSNGLIYGIILSNNERMHEQLCKLLLAARLQEGLRQTICENADMGSQKAFLAILNTILENDLIRFSSVKRAVGTWLGLVSDETRDLERVSVKSVTLAQRCLQEFQFREACLQSEDAMQIYIALWSLAKDAVEAAAEKLGQIAERGTRHQVLAAGYLVNNMENDLLRHYAAKIVVRRFPEEWDILAVYLPCFVPYHNVLATSLSRKKPQPEAMLYFASHQEAAQYYDWLVELHGKLKKKELVFEPCIFPWHKAVLKKSDLLEKAMVIAFLGKDLDRIRQLCPKLGEFDANFRDAYLGLLDQVEKDEPVRKALVAGLCDRSYDTRRRAAAILREMVLTQEEYLAIEDMLRLRYEDLRGFATEFLLKQTDDALCESIRRLLSASKTEKRTAALDMLLQLHKKAERTYVVETCTDYVRAIQNPTTQEKILIDQLLPKAAKPEKKVLFTEADRYMPQVGVDDFAKECIREFMAIFPDSQLESQVLAGKPVAAKVPLLKPKACATVQETEKLIKSLSDFFVAHETEHFRDLLRGEIPVGCHINLFSMFTPTDVIGFSVPRMDLWQQWQMENTVTTIQLLRMYALLSAQKERGNYLKRCGSCMSDLFGPGFERPVTYRYMEHMHRIVQVLLREQLTKEERQRIAAAIGVWIARCLPEDMILGCDKVNKEEAAALLQVPHYQDMQVVMARELQRHTQGSPAGHFVGHPQIAYFLFWLDPGMGQLQKHILPISINVFGRSFRATNGFMLENYGQTLSGTHSLIFDQLFGSLDRYFEKYKLPDVSSYLHARNYHLISDATLYYHMMEKNSLKSALELVTSVCALYPQEGVQVSAKAFSGWRTPHMRRVCENLVDEKTPDAKMIALCHRVSQTLVELVLESELVRGDSLAEYSRVITGIQSISGAETFVRILSALGKDPLDRNTYYYVHTGGAKRENLSYLLAHCAPAQGDSADTLAKLLQGTDITKKRLVEAALYSPDWIDIIGEHLGFTGFKSACYYFMAHMNEQFDEQKKAIIARFTPLTDDELNMGAFDMDWFRSAYEQLGEKDFDLIYDAAKYISDGSKHTRARKFADAALGKLDVAATEAEIKDKRNKDLLMAYAIIPLEGDADLSHRYFFLQQFLKESRQFGAQRSASEKKAVEAALRNLATNAGFSDTMRLTLRMETKLVEENSDLFSDHQVQEWVFRLDVDDQGSTEILCFKDGKQLKSLPAKAKKDPYVLRLVDMKKQLTEQYRRTRRMFEQAMEDGATFSLAELRDLAKNPVVAPIVSKLVFKAEDTLAFFGSETLDALDGHTQLIVAHPFHLYTSGQWPAFQKYLFDERIIQPFRQVFRELYVKTADELGQLHSLRYAGNQIQPKKAAACLKERRWVADVEAGLQKVYYRENIVATIFAMADWFTPADIEAPTLEYVAFYHRKTGEALKIDDIPEVIFSEVMRDVDMAVSVAHAGGVDPETSHSTVEMRAAILGFTLPLLRLDNIRIDGNHALVEGKLARYSIHLGSGVIHQIGGTMLSVLPVHSQHRGRIFLPFVDEDPKTAEIISKVILFAEDHKLKDPSILSQIAPGI